MRIFIEQLSFKTIIGILKQEREEPQNVIVDCTIDYEKGFVNYAEAVAFLKETIIEKEFGLIEDGLSFLAEGLYRRYPNINQIELKITKPDILHDCKVGVSKKFNFC